MKLEIVKIQNKGKLNEEYVELKATSKCQLKYYMITDTTYTSENMISNKVRNTYRFAEKEVNKGDTVLLFSGKGKASSTNNVDSPNTHKLYWGLGKSVWNNEGDAAILFNIKSWKTTKA
ncbi:hypothetical protein ABVD55_001182 [Vibrio harveyi]